LLRHKDRESFQHETNDPAPQETDNRAKAMSNRKFLMCMSKEDLRPILEQAKIRGITKQEEIRAIIIPEWLAIERRRRKRAKR
jgi:hypothetical protein